MKTEIEPNAPLTNLEKAAVGILAMWPVLAVLVIGQLVGGCRAFYENAGSRTVVGSVTAPIDISDASDNIAAKILYSMEGASVYTAKDSLVKITYRNAYTNDYFAIVKTRGVQDLSVEIEPLDVGGGSTNVADSVNLTTK